MNSVNWAGNTDSKNIDFQLTVDDKQRVLGPIPIEIERLDDKSGLGVAKELVRVWTRVRGLPLVLRIGGTVHFIANVSKVELRKAGGDADDWVTVPSDGAAKMVPGNDGLVVWRS